VLYGFIEVLYGKNLCEVGVLSGLAA